MWTKHVLLAPCALVSIVAGSTETHAQNATAQLNAPAACGAACRRRMEGDFRRGDPQAMQSVLAAYKTAQGDNTVWQVVGHGSRYSAAAVVGVGSAGLPTKLPGVKTPVTWKAEAAYGAAVAVTARGLEDLGQYALTRYDEAVKTAFVQAADKALAGKLIDPQTGRINNEVLEANGTFDFLTSASFWTSIDADHREALTFARGKFEIELLKASVKDGIYTQQMLKGNGEILNKTYLAMKATREGMFELRDLAQDHTKAIEDFRDESNQQSTNLKKVVSAGLPPRQQLDLYQKGLIALEADELDRVTRTVRADNIRDVGGKVSAAFKGIASIPGLKPEVAQACSQASEVADGVVGFAAAFATQNYIGMAMSAFSLMGSIGGFGKKSGPSPEMMMMQTILKELRELRTTIIDLHNQEMEALAEINANLLDMRAQLVSQLTGLQYLALDTYRAVEGLNSVALNTCRRLELEYWDEFGDVEQWTIYGFAAWMTRNKAAVDYTPCVQGIKDSYLRLPGDDLNTVFTPIEAAADTRYQGTDAAVRLAAAQQSVRMLFRTALAYGDAHDLLNADARRKLRTPQRSFADLQSFANAPVPMNVTGDPPPKSYLAASGGHRVIDTQRFLEISQTFRMILEWGGLLWEFPNSTDIAGVTRDQLDICSKTPSQCQLREPSSSALQLRRLLQVSQWLLEQEQLSVGVPLAAHAVSILDKEVLPGYARARNGEDLAAFQLKMTREPAAVDPADFWRSTAHCATRVAARDSICLIQTNEFISRNVITYLIWSRIKRSYATDYEAGVRAYAAALTWHDQSLLRQVLGDDLFFVDGVVTLSSDVPTPTSGHQWLLELPRVFTKRQQQQFSSLSPDKQKKVADRQKIAPSSCWQDRRKGSGQDEFDKDNDPELQEWADGLTVGDEIVIGKSAWARCYELPHPSTLRQQAIIERPGLTELIADQQAILTAIAEAKP